MPRRALIGHRSAWEVLLPHLWGSAAEGGEGAATTAIRPSQQSPSRLPARPQPPWSFSDS